MTASQPKPNRTRSIAWKTAIALTCLHGSTACANHTEATKDDLSNLVIVETEYLPPELSTYTMDHLCRNSKGAVHNVLVKGEIHFPDGPGWYGSRITELSIDGIGAKKTILNRINDSIPETAALTRPYLHCGPGDIRIRIPYILIEKGKVVEGFVSFQMNYEAQDFSIKWDY